MTLAINALFVVFFVLYVFMHSFYSYISGHFMGETVASTNGLIALYDKEFIFIIIFLVY